MTSINWFQAAVEAPLAACVAVFLYKCYRARVRLGCDSPCSKWCGMKFKIEMPGEITDARRTPSDDLDLHLAAAEGHGDGSEHVVEQRTSGDSATVGDFAAGEASLEEGTTNGHRF